MTRVKVQPGGGLEWKRGGSYPVKLGNGERSEQMVTANRPLRRAVLNILHGHFVLRRASTASLRISGKHPKAAISVAKP